MSLRRLFSLCLICGLWSAGLLAPQPAQAQSGVFCSSEGNVASVAAEVILDCLRAGMPVNFDGVTVTGDLDLADLRNFSGSTPLVIRNSRFTGSLTAFDGDPGATVTFQERVDLRGSRFAGVVDFTGAVFMSFAHFGDVRFESLTNFTQAVFHNGASFSGASFMDSVSFMMAQNQGGLDFAEAQFNGQTNFSLMQSFQESESPLQSDVTFSGAQFDGALFFMNANIQNQIIFDDTIFRRSAPGEMVNVSNATFTTLSLTGANFESGQLDLNGTHYEKLLMDNFQPAILPSDTSGEVLTALKDNFRRQGRLDITSEIEYWQYAIERRDKPGLTPILETFFLDWTFGYGLKPLKAVRTSVILILLFAIFYYPDGVLRPAAFAPSKPRERRFTIRLVEIPIAQAEESAKTNGKHRSLPLPPQATQAWRALVFSFGVFTKLSSGNTVAVRFGALVIAEWIIGLMVTAGFLFSLANTNQLLRAVLDLLK